MMLAFGVSMGYFEASIVVYLRDLYYPDGFSFPLVMPHPKIITVEIGRELASIVMLASVAFIAGKRLWERFGWFIFLFGVWDIVYYIVLRIVLGWPTKPTDWDILFLIPLPWIGPIIAPCLISIQMIVCGVAITTLYDRGYRFRPTALSRVMAILGTGLILYSFMRDIGAGLHQSMPKPYPYPLLIIGLLLYWAAYCHVYRETMKRGRDY